MSSCISGADSICAAIFKLSALHIALNSHYVLVVEVVDVVNIEHSSIRLAPSLGTTMQPRQTTEAGFDTYGVLEGSLPLCNVNVSIPRVSNQSIKLELK